MNSKIETDLLGTELPGGWVIDNIRPRLRGATGGAHAMGYTATHLDGRNVFVKILNLWCRRKACWSRSA